MCAQRPASRISNFRSAVITLGKWYLTQRALIRTTGMSLRFAMLSIVLFETLTARARSGFVISPKTSAAVSVAGTTTSCVCLEFRAITCDLNAHQCNAALREIAKEFTPTTREKIVSRCSRPSTERVTQDSYERPSCHQRKDSVSGSRIRAAFGTTCPSASISE